MKVQSTIVKLLQLELDDMVQLIKLKFFKVTFSTERIFNATFPVPMIVDP